MIKKYFSRELAIAVVFGLISAFALIITHAAAIKKEEEIRENLVVFINNSNEIVWKTAQARISFERLYEGIRGYAYREKRTSTGKISDYNDYIFGVDRLKSAVSIEEIIKSPLDEDLSTSFISTLKLAENLNTLDLFKDKDLILSRLETLLRDLASATNNVAHFNPYLNNPEYNARVIFYQRTHYFLIIGLLCSLIVGGIVVQARLQNEKRKAEIKRRKDIEILAAGQNHATSSLLLSMKLSLEALSEKDKASVDIKRIGEAIRQLEIINAWLKLVASGYNDHQREKTKTTKGIFEELSKIYPKVLFHLDSNDSDMLVPETPVKTILIEFIQNALDHNKKHKGLEVSLKYKSDQDNDYFFVADNGRGVDMKEAEKIVSPYYTTGEDGHSGLGLAACVKLAEQIGGKIRVAGGLNKGATFVLEIKKIGEKI